MPQHWYTLSTSGVDVLYRDLVKSITDIVKQCIQVGITTDGWTGPKALGYWALTLNGITDDFKWVNTPLSLMAIPSTHSTKHLASHLLTDLKMFDITKAKTAGLTTDEGGSAPFIAEELNGMDLRDDVVEEQHCACHMCVTAQKHAFKLTFNKFPDFENLLLQCSVLASSFRHQSSVRAPHNPFPVATCFHYSQGY